MDREDENGDRFEDIYNQLRNAYCQIQLASQGLRAARPVSQVTDIPENISGSAAHKPGSFSQFVGLCYIIMLLNQIDSS